MTLIQLALLECVIEAMTVESLPIIEVPSNLAPLGSGMDCAGTREGFDNVNII